MTWPEYYRTVSGYEARQAREWERTRKLGWWMLTSNGVKTKTGKALTEKGLLPLSTDKVTERAVEDVDAARAFRDKIEAQQLAKQKK